MKTFLLFLMLAVSASAQTLKWEIDTLPPEKDFESASFELSPDGVGNCLLIARYERLGGEIMLNVMWIDKERFATFVQRAEGVGVKPTIVVRMLPRKVFLLEYPTEPTHEQKVYLTRFRVNGRGYAVDHNKRQLEDGETLVPSPQVKDPKGFFTVVTGEKGEPLKVRRFSN